MAIIKLKNCQETADTYCGQEIGAGEYYQLQGEEERVTFSEDQKVQNHLSSDPAKLLVNDGTTDLSYLKGEELLEGNTPKDPDGRPQFRRIVTRPAWYYSPHSLDWTTSKYLSLYNRDHTGAGIDDGTDMADAWMQFFDDSDTELTKGAEETPAEFQARLDTDCVKTVVMFEKEESFDLQGAFLYIQNEPVDRAYLWCIFAPDIPYEYGGSKPFMGRGMNLQMIVAKEQHYFDAVSASTITPDPVYHSGKIGMYIKHAAGAKIGIQIVFVMYEE